MSYELAAPATLQEAVVYFADAQVSHDFLTSLRWPEGVVCPRCDCHETTFISTRRIWRCKGCKKQFSVKVGTIFEDSPLGLGKWLPALWMLANCKNGISSYELARGIGVTQKTAWFMLGRIRLAMQTRSFKKTHGTVEIDESYMGGKAKNMHKSKRMRIMGNKKAGTSGKSGVIAAVVRGNDEQASRALAYVMKDSHARPHGRMAEETVHEGGKVYTDRATLYKGSMSKFIHESVNHSEKEYVRGEVHTNGVENFWSLLKRSIKGTYVSVDPFHLFRYVDEQVFRFNERTETDCGRFVNIVRKIVGKRLTYADLTGANLDPATT